MVCSLGLFGCPETVEPTDGGVIKKDAGTVIGADSGTMMTDAGMTMTDAGTIDAGPGEIADFAKDLILNHSSDPNPTTTEDKTFAPDTQDATKFPASFFQ